jgi:hypothetical protein
MSDPAELSFYVHKVPRTFADVVVETADEHDHVFAESPVINWSDLDRLAQQYGVPTERIFIDDDARAVLDAA